MHYGKQSPGAGLGHGEARMKYSLSLHILFRFANGDWGLVWTLVWRKKLNHLYESILMRLVFLKNQSTGLPKSKICITLVSYKGMEVGHESEEF